MLDYKAEIKRLQEERNAIILAHNYQLEEIQDIADKLGDSFYLSKVSAQTEHRTIVFCGVHFMAETAKLLSPAKTVLLPEREAGCPMADMVTAEALQAWKMQHPGVPIVCYVNSSAAVKAESDICCTSANAVRVVASLPDKQVLFVPDKNLGDYVAKQLPDKELLLWPGYCVTHAKIKPQDVLTVRQHYPEAEFLIHPECDPAVVALADFAGSTSQIIDRARQSTASQFVIGTEMGVLCKLRALLPDKQFFLLHPGLVCPNMKKTRLVSVYQALRDNRQEIHIDESVRVKARATLERMLALI